MAQFLACLIIISIIKLWLIISNIPFDSSRSCTHHVPMSSIFQIKLKIQSTCLHAIYYSYVYLYFSLILSKMSMVTLIFLIAFESPLKRKKWAKIKFAMTSNQKQEHRDRKKNEWLLLSNEQWPELEQLNANFNS